MQVDVAVFGVVLSAVSTLVVIVGGVAALRQLRYLRHGNELTTLNALQTEWHRPDLEAARAFALAEMPGALNDPAFVAELRSASLGPRAQHLARIGSFFELMGIYVCVGALSERTVMLMWALLIQRYWLLCRDALAIRRAEHGYVLEFFEDLAMRAPEWCDHSAANWPKGLRRDSALANAAPGIPAAEP